MSDELSLLRARFLNHRCVRPDLSANPELLRLALKLATGAGKTTVMAMLIAWQAINAVRRPESKNFTRGFLVVTPGLTIKAACGSCCRTIPTKPGRRGDEAAAALYNRRLAGALLAAAISGKGNEQG